MPHGNGHAEEAYAHGGRGCVGFGGEVDARLDESEVGAQDSTVLRDVEGEAVQCRILGLALAQREGVAPLQDGTQQVGDPLVTARRGVVLPVRVARAQAGAFVLLQSVELRPGPAQDRHGEEGAGDLREVEPFLVLAAAVERLGLGCGETTGGGAGAHRRASFAGITKTTATGKR